MEREALLARRTKVGFHAFARGVSGTILWVSLLLPAMGVGQTTPGGSRAGGEPTSPMAPERAFEMAESEFRYQDYEKVVALLRPILYPTVTINDPEKRRTAREYLATSYWWIKQKELAREEFTALLVEHPDHTLDPFYNPGPLIAFFESLKKELQQQKLIDPDEKTTQIQSVQVAPAPNPWAVNLLPFGVPQFSYGNPSRGWLLMVGQSLSLAASVASGFAIEDLRGSDGLFSQGDADTARDFRVIWWTSTALMTTLYLTGVVDGFANAPVQRGSPPPNVADFEP